VKGYDGEKGYEYFSRSLIHMGAKAPSNPEALSESWRKLAECFLSNEYRESLSRLTGQDLSNAVLEVNAIHYGPNCWLGPHLDLKEKLVTHVLYFNEKWERADGGYLQILGSPEQSDVRGEVLPLVGNSAVLVRSEKSWHSVARVAQHCSTSRRSVNVIFHAPGSVSSMWPPGEVAELGEYRDGVWSPARNGKKPLFHKLIQKLAR
jgi:hypothetical protein